MCVSTHNQLTFNARLMGVAVDRGGMSDNARRNRVSVSGSSSYDSLDCETLDVSGKATVSRDLLADEVDVSGKATVGGDLESQDVETTGKLTVDGSAATDALTVSGKVAVGGNLDGHDVDASGKLDVDGSLVAAEASVSGKVEVGGLTDVTDLTVGGAGAFADVNVETFAGAGKVDADEFAADRFELTVDGRSTVGSLTASEVVVRDSDESGSFLRRLLGSDGVLDVGTVEGETVDLNATRADTVVGDAVALGPDAEAGTVYADDLDVHDDATVGEIRDRADY
jgi:cytoskeletal protein CcmA (bactofilin family)